MVLTPKKADNADFSNGLGIAIGIFLAMGYPGVGIATVLAFGVNAICVSIERLIPADSEHRHTQE